MILSISGCVHVNENALVPGIASPAPARAASTEPQAPGLKILHATFVPDAQNPTAFNLTASLTIANNGSQPLDVREPDFQIHLDGVPFGDLASTDFQTGRIEPHSTLTIELQKTVMLRFTNNDIENVLARIKHQQAVGVLVSGHVTVGNPPQKAFLHKELEPFVLP